MKKLLDKPQLLILFSIVMLFLMLSLVFCNLNYIKYGILKNQQLYIVLKKTSPNISTLSADSTNNVALIANVVNSEGVPVRDVDLNIFEKNNYGSFFSKTGVTDSAGNSIFVYNPPNSNGNFKQKDIEIIAKIGLTGQTDSVRYKLSHVPLILVHGYQEYSSLFDDMKGYFEETSFNVSVIDYDSQKGVLEASKTLKTFIDERKNSYLSNSFQVNKVDIIAHSMGGLVARYYTCSDEYLQKRNNIRKIIFISVPHKGSPWAPLALKYLSDKGIQDLSSTNEFLSKTLPKLYNRGLNPSIQTGNLLAQFDEVVSENSAALDEWNIKTELFNVGNSSISVNDLFNGNLLDAPNHRNILYNKAVFYKIFVMLTTNIKYPSKIK